MLQIEFQILKLQKRAYHQKPPMKKSIPILLLVLMIISICYYITNKLSSLSKAQSELTHLSANNELKNGYLIFQTSLSRQSKAIQLATRSKYSHCGIIYKEGNEYYVFEAVQPVKKTSLAEWMARGQDIPFRFNFTKENGISRRDLG